MCFSIYITNNERPVKAGGNNPDPVRAECNSTDPFGVTAQVEQHPPAGCFQMLERLVLTAGAMKLPSGLIAQASMVPVWPVRVRIKAFELAGWSHILHPRSCSRFAAASNLTCLNAWIWLIYPLQAVVKLLP